MKREEDRDNFEKWLNAWDQAAEQFAKEAADELAKTAERKQPQVSYFTNAPSERDYREPDLEEDPSWQDIYARSQNLHGLLTDDIKYSDGEPKPQADFGAFTRTKSNPTTQSSVGVDQEPRVTKNWSDGPELRELDEIKRRIEELERKHHESEVKGGPSLKKELESLRERIGKLSEKINREPEVDVT